MNELKFLQRAQLEPVASEQNFRLLHLRIAGCNYARCDLRSDILLQLSLDDLKHNYDRFDGRDDDRNRSGDATGGCPVAEEPFSLEAIWKAFTTTR